MTPMTFEYRIAMLQQGKVTYVNGQWAGRMPLQMAVSNSAKGLESCDDESTWLQNAGAEGWELVSVTVTPVQVPGSQETLTRMYLKRRRS